MVCLDKDKIINKKKTDKKKTNQELPFKQFNLFANKVLKKISDDNLPPTPEIYQIYFDKMIQTQPIIIKEQLQNILSLHKNQNINTLTLDAQKELDNSFTLIKSMLNYISDSYKKIYQIQALTKIKKDEISKNPNKFVLISFEDSLKSLSNSLNNNLKTLKTKYDQILNIAKKVEQKSIYDERFHTYNKKYFLQKLSDELENVKNFKHSSIVLAIKIKDDSLKNLKMSKDKNLIMKNVAKLIIKSSNKSDIVAYFEDDIFVVLLKYTDQKQIEKYITKIKDLIASASFIIDSNDIDIDILSGFYKIDPNLTKEEIIYEAIKNLSN